MLPCLLRRLLQKNKSEVRLVACATFRCATVLADTDGLCVIFAAQVALERFMALGLQVLTHVS